MSEAIFSLLDSFSEAAVLIHDGTVAACSPLAHHYLPQLQSGGAVLDVFPQAPAPGGGIFSTGTSSYTYSVSCLEQGQLIVFRPAPQTSLTDTQLDGVLRQLRQFMGEFLLEMADDQSEHAAAFRQSYYRMFRLLDNLDYLHRQEEPSCRAAMDLAGLCSQLVQQAAPLLKQGGVLLEYASPLSSLIIPGDPALLRRMLLELISNSARAVGRGTVRLELRRTGNQALITLCDSGCAPTQRQLARLLQQDSDQAIPSPGAGAGLGLSIVRRIVSAHGGTMLVECGEAAPVTLVSLPTGPLDPRATVRTPTLSRDGGLSPLLTALADALPLSVFETAELD